MTIRVEAILPKKVISAEASERILRKYLRDFATGVQKEMSEYPPRQPWKSRTPRKGPRSGGKRTGQYKAGWKSAPIYGRASVSIINPVEYAAVVGGPKAARPGQIGTHRRRGWKSISTVAPEVNRRVLPRLSTAFTPIGVESLLRR